MFGVAACADQTHEVFFTTALHLKAVLSRTMLGMSIQLYLYADPVLMYEAACCTFFTSPPSSATVSQFIARTNCMVLVCSV